MNLRRNMNGSAAAQEPTAAKPGRRKKKPGKRAFSRTANAILIVAAVALLIASFLFPVLMISGDSMEPGLNDGDLVLLVKTRNMHTGDLVSFRWNGKTLLKRVVGRPGDWVMMDGQGRVYVNGALLDEPYVAEFGACEKDDVAYPFHVPEDSYFVMGDNRIASVDSRNTHVGCVRYDQIIGKGVVKLWPWK